MCDYRYKSGNRKGYPCRYKGYKTLPYKGKSYCPFHLPIEKKEKDLFMEVLEKLINDFRKHNGYEWDFEGFVFTEECNEFFKELEYPEFAKLNFSRATFEGGIDFRDKTFNREICFEQTEFLGEADFYHTIFKNGVNFGGAKFKARARFWKAEFYDQACFMGAEFFEFANFWVAKFNCKANFHGAKFLKNTNFSEAKFFKTGSRAIFNEVEFSGNANFENAFFEVIAEFQYVDFEGNVDFCGPIVFPKNVYFNSARFGGRADFTGVNYLENANFNWSTFSGEVYFSDAKLKHIDFSSSNFYSSVSFKNADFGIVDFTGAVFRIRPYMGNLGACSKKIYIHNIVGDVFIEFTRGFQDIELVIKKDSIEVKRSDIVEPIKITVEGGDIDGVLNFYSPLNILKFKETSLHATINVDPLRECHTPLFEAFKTNFYGDTIVRNIKVKGIKDSIIGAKFVLRDVDLRQASFEGTSDLRRIDFINVTWSKLNRSLNGCIHSLRKLDVLYDELKQFCKENSDDHNFEENPVDAPKPKDCIPDEKERDKVLKNLSEMYRAVASSFESRQRYGSAGPFKVGEFDMRKWMMKDVSGLERFVLRAYRFFSSYGESVVKPLVCLLLIWLIPAFCYSLFGELIDVSKILKTNSICFTQALSLSFQACLPVKSSLVDRLVENWSWVPLVQRGLFAIFTAFFLFALRRKVKR